MFIKLPEIFNIDSKMGLRVNTRLVDNYHYINGSPGQYRIILYTATKQFISENHDKSIIEAVMLELDSAFNTP